MIACTGKIQAGGVSDHISAFWDMMPTFQNYLVKVKVRTDGISLLLCYRRRSKDTSIFIGNFTNKEVHCSRKGN